MRNGMKCKRIVSPMGTFRSVADLKEQRPEFYYGKLEKLPHLYYFEEDGPGEPTYEKVWYSPYGVFAPKLRGKIYEKASETNFEGINDSKDKCHWWNKMCRLYPNEFYMKKEIKREWDLEK